MGFITRSIFVCKFIISGLKPVHLSSLYLQNKKRLLQGFLKTLAAEENLVMVTGTTLAIIQYPFIILSQGVTVVKMPQ